MPTLSIYDPNVYYSTISIYLYSVLGSTLIIMGTIGSISSCIVFAQKAMRQNPASIYFIAYSIANLIRLWESLFLAIMTYHGIDPVNRDVSFCKIHFYIQFVFFMLTPYYLILSSIDRVLVTSSDRRTRERSTIRLAYRSIAGVTLMFAVFFVQLFPFINIYPCNLSWYLYMLHATRQLSIVYQYQWFCPQWFSSLSSFDNIWHIHLEKSSSRTRPTSERWCHHKQRSTNKRTSAGTYAFGRNRFIHAFQLCISYI